MEDETDHGDDTFSVDLHMWESPGWDYVRERAAATRQIMEPKPNDIARNEAIALCKAAREFDSHQYRKMLNWATRGYFAVLGAALTCGAIVGFIASFFAPTYVAQISLGLAIIGAFLIGIQQTRLFRVASDCRQNLGKALSAVNWAFGEVNGVYDFVSRSVTQKVVTRRLYRAARDIYTSCVYHDRLCRQAATRNHSPNERQKLNADLKALESRVKDLKRTFYHLRDEARKYGFKVNDKWTDYSGKPDDFID